MASGEKQKASPDEKAHAEHDPSPAPYSIFSPLRKRCIAYAASFGAMFSGLSSFIYYPAISPLASALDTSIELINLTITSYQIVLGLHRRLLVIWRIRQADDLYILPLSWSIPLQT